jgi:hypothetical protein
MDVYTCRLSRPIANLDQRSENLVSQKLNNKQQILIMTRIV